MADRETAKQPALRVPAAIEFHVAGRVLSAPYREGESVLETARRAAISINTGCEKGDCGACIVSVLSGAVRMRRNNVLSSDEVESGLVLACQGAPDSAELSVEIF